MSTHPHNHASGHACCGAKASDGAATVKDPVCGMSVDPTATAHRASHDGQDYFFCSAGCRTKFIGDPMRYLNPPVEAEPAVPGAIYTCPMHPEIRQEGPGSCPICGMALEPETVTAEAPPNHELIDFTRRFWVGLVLTLPVFALEMGGHLANLHMFIPGQMSNWIQFALATPVVLWCGLAVLPARLDLAAHAPSEHVHPDRHGRRRGLGLQRGRSLRSNALFPPAFLKAWMEVRRCISRRRRSSPSSSWSARFWSCARENRRPAPSAPCWI